MQSLLCRFSTILRQLVEMCRKLDILIPEQAIEVPKILLDDVSMRTVTQLAEQQVEVRMIISFSSLQRTVEQNVGIPGGGLQGFRPGQCSPSSSSSVSGSDDDADELGEGFFALFSVPRKVRRSPGTRVRECPGTPAHPRWALIKWLPMMSVRRGTTRSVSRRGAALGAALAALIGACSERATPNGSSRGSEGREGASDSGLRQSGGAVPVLGQGHGERWLECGYGAGCARVLRSVSLRQFLAEFPLLHRFARAVRTWKFGHFSFASYHSVLVLVFGCRLWSTALWIFRRSCLLLGSTVDTCSSGGFGRILHIFNVAVNSFPEAFRLHSRRMESVHSRCFWF